MGPLSLRIIGYPGHGVYEITNFSEQPFKNDGSCDVVTLDLRHPYVMETLLKFVEYALYHSSVMPMQNKRFMFLNS